MTESLEHGRSIIASRAKLSTRLKNPAVLDQMHVHRIETFTPYATFQNWKNLNAQRDKINTFGKTTTFSSFIISYISNSYRIPAFLSVPYGVLTHPQLGVICVINSIQPCTT